MMKTVLLLICALVLLSCGCQAQPRHVVVLMLENRSFDHMLGHLQANNSQIDGPPQGSANRRYPHQPNSPLVPISFDAEDYIAINPSHSFKGTNKEMWGQTSRVDPAPMIGFVWANQGDPRVMQLYNYSTLPILSQLALEYTLFDRWYCSVPGPTQPNRMYVHSGTSHGQLHNPNVDDWIDGTYAPQRTIYDDLTDEGLSWRVYFSDFPMTLTLDRVRYYPSHIKPMWDFYQDAKHGRLPHYSFLEPRWFSVPGFPENDQHPPHRVSLGEELIYDVYQALRKGPLWNETLLVITYDEHGGLWDHVGPPQNHVPNPDGIDSRHPPFSFHRLGVRVATLLISPWMPRGWVEHEPARSRYEHTSIIHSLRTLFNMTRPPLTDREAWSATFNHLFLAKPRTDWLSLPTPHRDQGRSYRQPHAETKEPTNDLQTDLVTIAWSLFPNGPLPPYSSNANQSRHYVLDQWTKWHRSQKPHVTPPQSKV